MCLQDQGTCHGHEEDGGQCLSKDGVDMSRMPVRHTYYFFTSSMALVVADGGLCGCHSQVTGLSKLLRKQETRGFSGGTSTSK